MISKYFNRPLQGKYFRIFCDVIMGYSCANTLFGGDLPIKECVEKCNNIKMIKNSTVPCIKKESKIDHTLTC